MKMRPEHFDALKAAVNPILNPAVVAQYKAAGLSEGRMLWDVLHASRFDTRPLYVYLNDSHIETALRAALVERAS